KRKYSSNEYFSLWHKRKSCNLFCYAPARRGRLLLLVLALITPPRGERPLTHRRSGLQVPRRVAALVCPLRDTRDDTTGHRHRPDRSGSVADSGHIFARGMYCQVASRTTRRTSDVALAGTPHPSFPPRGDCSMTTISIEYKSP